MKLKKFPVELIAIPMYFATIELERRWMKKHAEERGLRGYNEADAKTSLAMGTASVVVKFAMAPLQARVMRAAFDRRVVSHRSRVVEVAIAMVGWDLIYYWWHRANHRSRIAWAVHSQHHSSEYYNLSTALRQGSPEHSGLLFFPLLGFIGVSPWANGVSGGLNLIYQYWIHTEAIDRMPKWFERVFNTPSHHRAHHGVNPQYIDKNYGGILISWDRLLGTFEPEQERVVYGLTKNLNTYDLKVAIGGEFQAIERDVRSWRGLRAKLGAVFMPPDWTPKSESSALASASMEY